MLPLRVKQKGEAPSPLLPDTRTTEVNHSVRGSCTRVVVRLYLPIITIVSLRVRPHQRPAAKFSRSVYAGETARSQL